jgi:hypothetical protein
MRRSAALLTVTATVLASALAGCSAAGSSGTTAPAAASTTATKQASTAATASAASAAATSPAASASPSSSQSGVATPLDPCQLVPASEASAVAGTTFGAGQEEPSGTDGKRCVYGSQTRNVFSVVVGQADNAADAEADYSTEEADAQAAITKQVPAGVKINEQTQDVSGLADRATVVSGSASVGGASVAASAIYLLKGAVFLTFSDVVVGAAAPSASALEAEATKALARVP